MQNTNGGRLKIRKLTEKELEAQRAQERKDKGLGVAGVIKGWPGLLVAGVGIVTLLSLYPVSPRAACVVGGSMFAIGLVWFGMGENPMGD